MSSFVEVPKDFEEVDSVLTKYGDNAEKRKNLNAKLAHRAKLLGLGLLSPIAAVILNKKMKLTSISDKVPRKICKLSTNELDAIKEYEKNLSEQIDKLLSQNHDSYKLEICKLKYQNLRKFIVFRIKECFANVPSSKFGIFRNKVIISSLVKQLEIIQEKIKKIDDKIKINDRKSRITRIFDKVESYEKEIASESAKLSGISDSLKKTRIEAKILNLKIHKNALLTKRNILGTKMKYKAIKRARKTLIARGLSNKRLFAGFMSDTEFDSKYGMYR